MKNTFEIELNNKGEKQTVKLLFGNWMCGQLVKEGFDLNTFNPSLYENPYLLAPFVFYLAACNGKDFSRDDFDDKDFLRWAEDADNRPLITKGLDVFYRSVFGDQLIDEIHRLSSLTEEQKAEESKKLASTDKKKVVKKKL